MFLHFSLQRSHKSVLLRQLIISLNSIRLSESLRSVRSAAFFVTIISVLLLFTPYLVSGQSRYSITGTLVDAKTAQPVAFISIRLGQGDRHRVATTLEDGSFVFEGLTNGNYLLEVKALGYAVLSKPLEISYSDTLRLLLEPTERTIDEVYVTASEATELTAASVIDRKAMELLQPASFADLLELLPGRGL